MTVLLLARHGETDWNAQHRWQGHADPLLNDRGLAQAEALAEELAGEGIDAIYASDLARARQTAEIVARRLRVPVKLLGDLREIDFGEAEGLTTAEVEERYPGALAAYRERGEALPGGETTANLTTRALAAVKRIADEHPDGTILVVAHGGSIRAVAAAATAVDYADYWRRNPTLANCAVSRVGCTDGVLSPWADAPVRAVEKGRVGDR